MQKRLQKFSRPGLQAALPSDIASKIEVVDQSRREALREEALGFIVTRWRCEAVDQY